MAEMASSIGNDAPEAIDDRLFRKNLDPASYHADEVQTVNATLAGAQENPATARFTDGKYVVVWQSTYNPSDPAPGIRARVFNGDGTQFTAGFTVNEDFSGYQQHPSVAVLNNGNFVVTWVNTGVDEDEENSISARIFSADGTAIVSEFPIENENVDRERDTSVIALENGGFVISWEELNSQSRDYNIRAAIFDADGTKTVDDFYINRETASYQENAELAALPDGKFIAIWKSYDGADPSGAGIKGRIFDANGRVIADEFLVNETTDGLQGFPSVAAREDGGFAVVWYTQEDGYDYKARIFNADGTEAASEFQINDADLRVGEDAAVAWLPGGQLLVAWRQYPSDTAQLINAEIKARIFNSDGSEAVPEFSVSSTDALSVPDISVFADGRFVISWQSDWDAVNATDILSRVFEFSEAGDDLPFTSEDNPVTLNVADLLANDGDADGDQLTFSLVDLTSEFGAALLYDETTGSLTYDPTVSAELQAMNAGDILEDEFVYTVSDGNGGSDQATVTLLVGGEDGVEGDTVVANDDLLASGGMTQNPELVARNEFTVNESDSRWHETPVVAQTTNGGSIVVWQVRSFGADGEDFGIRARILDANGSEVVSEFRIDSGAHGGGNPNISLLPDGKFVVAWSATDVSSSGNYYSQVKLRIFNGDGTVASEEFSASQTLANEELEQGLPTVTALEDGNFVVTWQTQTHELTVIHDWYTLRSTSYGKQAAIFDDHATRLVDDFQLSETESDTQALSSNVAAIPGGGFVAVWSSRENENDPEFGGIVARVFNSDGTESVSEFLVNATTSGNQSYPDVSVSSDGDFVVLWHSQGESDGDGFAHLRASIHHPDGSIAVSEFDVMSTTQQPPGAMYGEVEYLPNGQFVIAWNDYDAGLVTYQDVYAQVFNADGSAFTEPFLVNDHTAETQFDPFISVLDEDSFMIAWRSQDGSGTSDTNISAKIFDLTGTPIEAYYTTEDNPVAITSSVLLSNDDFGSETSFLFELSNPRSALGADLDYDNETGILTYNPTVSAALQTLAEGETYRDKFSYTLTSIDGKISRAEVVLVVGGLADDIDAGKEDNLIWGGTAADRLSGRNGNDTVLGGEGDDTIDGRAGHDTILGGDGNDTIYGKNGRDNLYGGDGDDHLYGGSASTSRDTLYGGSGRDVLVGGDGNNIIYGGLGADVFVLTAKSAGSSDQIHDFRHEEGDRIDISEFLDSAAPQEFSMADFVQITYETNNAKSVVWIDADGAGTLMDYEKHSIFHNLEAEITLDDFFF